jgi:hypothetical protein
VSVMRHREALSTRLVLPKIAQEVSRKRDVAFILNAQAHSGKIA